MSKILVIEDDLGMREELATLLENNGYEVLAVENFGGVVEVGQVARMSQMLSVEIGEVNIIFKPEHKRSPAAVATGL